MERVHAAGAVALVCAAVLCAGSWHAERGVAKRPVAAPVPPVRAPASVPQRGPGIGAAPEVAPELPPSLLDLDRRVAALLGGVLVSCEARGFEDGATFSVAWDVPPERLGQFPQGADPQVADGAIRFAVPAASEGHGTWQVEGVARGTVAWPAAAAGSTVSCSSFQERVSLTLAHGTVVDGDGEPARASWVEGCGGHAYASESDGAFDIVVEAGAPCVLTAMRGADMARASGASVEVTPTADVELEGVRLVAPEPPEMRPPTPAESAASARQMCGYWGGQWSQMAALMRASSLPGVPEAEAMVADMEAKQRAAAADCAPYRH